MQISHVIRTIDDYIGHGKYIRSVSDSAREIGISFVLKIDTKYETIIVDNMINLVPSDPNIQHRCPNSTHFIAGIQWGVIGVLMLKSKVNESNDEASIRAVLKTKLAALKINPGSKKKNDDSSYPKISNKDLNIEFELFIAKEFYELSDQPKNVDEAVEFMQKLPSLVSKVNNGKGTKISYRMLHLNACRKYLSLNNPANLSFYPTADEFTIGEIVKVFDELDQSERELNDIRCDFEEYSFCMPDEVIEEVDQMIEAVDKGRSDIGIMQMQSVVKKIRMGNSDKDKLQEIIDRYGKMSISRSSIEAFIKSLGIFIEKINYIAKLHKNNAYFVAKKSSLYAEVKKHKLKEFYIFFCSWNKLENSSTLLNKFSELLLSKKLKCVFVDMDCEPQISQKEFPPKDNTIYLHKDRKYKLLLSAVLISVACCQEGDENQLVSAVL
ncbi:hypothetical protein WR25_08068 isoform B [Diploscapter pachys]|uniref:DUF7656 domain-containing protein n=1 Tax=Diploscapter pachys TaxID=2018661 RepID=A0A2A2J4X7_9BILA|nr:hypothetical protein WR25_08068 isoform B [Diploscapter pachys]